MSELLPWNPPVFVVSETQIDETFAQSKSWFYSQMFNTDATTNEAVDQFISWDLAQNPALDWKDIQFEKSAELLAIEAEFRKNNRHERRKIIAQRRANKKLIRHY